MHFIFNKYVFEKQLYKPNHYLSNTKLDIQF